MTGNLVLFFLLVLISSCSSSSDTPIEEVALKLAPSTLILQDNSECQQSLSLTAPGNWRARSNADWCRVSPEQGTASATQITLKIDMNATKAERTCTITVEAIDGKESVTANVVQPGRDAYNYQPTNSNAPQGMQSNASRIMQNIKIGWNLGNTLESDGGDWYQGPNVEMETTWGNPMTTEEMIKGVKKAGFNAIRIPVRWYNHADADMNVSAEWIARVKEVVDFGINNEMYVVLNSHHDNWYDRMVPGQFNETEVGKKFASLWTQIATTFKEYDEHLLFAGTNEVITKENGVENWGTPTAANQAIQSKLNQVFVDAVRATGGNNAWRVLVVQTYAANPEYGIAGFVKPEDKVENRLMLEFHYYQPWNYCSENAEDKRYYWGSAFSSFKPFASSGEGDVTAMFDRLQTKFVDTGLPVLMGEFGVVCHHEASDLPKADESRAYYLEYVVKEAKNHGFAGFFWDNNAWKTEGENFGLFDRNNGMKPYVQSAVDGILRGAEAGIYPY